MTLQRSAGVKKRILMHFSCGESMKTSASMKNRNFCKKKKFTPFQVLQHLNVRIRNQSELYYTFCVWLSRIKY